MCHTINAFRMPCIVLCAALLSNCNKPPGEVVETGLFFREGSKIDLGIAPGKATRSLNIVNGSAHDVELVSVRTSCGCAAAIVDEDNRKLGPNQSAEIKFSMSVAAGKQQMATVTVFTRSHGVLDLKVSARGRESRWKPMSSFVELGDIWLGDYVVSELHVRSTERLGEAPTSPWPKWVCLDSSASNAHSARVRSRVRWLS